MKAIIQRVSNASVTVDNKIVSKINKGMVILLGIKTEDTEKDSDYIIKKTKNLRIFPDEKGLMNKSVEELVLEILIISQFTLYGDCNKGNRPSFIKAMPQKQAKTFYETFVEKFKQAYPKIKDGIFGADMKVELINDGPVTIIIET